MAKLKEAARNYPGIYKSCGGSCVYVCRIKRSETVKGSLCGYDRTPVSCQILYEANIYVKAVMFARSWRVNQAYMQHKGLVNGLENSKAVEGGLAGNG